MDTADRISQYGIGFDSEPARPLNEELSRLTVIDAHEHLMPEHERSAGAPARTLDAYVAGLEQTIAEARAQGVLGMKLLKEAARLFRLTRCGRASSNSPASRNRSH